jgi:hypothetical protein
MWASRSRSGVRQRMYLSRCSPCTWQETFPRVEDFQVEVKEVSCENVEGWRYTYDMSNAPDRFACRDRRCLEGGFDLWIILAGMVYERKTFFEGTEYCSGQHFEGSDPSPCDHSFDVTIRLKYKKPVH